MKTIITATLASLLLVAEWNSLPAEAAVPYQSDDYGFPVEPAGAAQRRTRPGRSFCANQRASRSLRHSCDYSRDVSRSSRDARQIEPTVAKAESEELGRNIAKAQQELATISQEAGDDASTVADLKSIGDRLAKAAERHNQLHAECCKTSVDGEVTMLGCSDITMHLEHAMAEHAALLRSLENKVPSSEGSSATTHQHQ